MYNIYIKKKRIFFEKNSSKFFFVFYLKDHLSERANINSTKFKIKFSQTSFLLKLVIF